MLIRIYRREKGQISFNAWLISTIGPKEVLEYADTPQFDAEKEHFKVKKIPNYR